MRENRGSWYLLTGLVIGLILGLVYSFWIAPVEFARTAPQSLGSTYKDGYRVLIALAYDANGDIGRALARISLLQDDNSAAALAAQAQRLLADGGTPEEARALSELSDALLVHSAAMATSAAPSTVAVEATPRPGETLPVTTRTSDPERAILTPTSAPSEAPTLLDSPVPRSTILPDELTNAPFTLDEIREVCDLQVGELLLQIEVLDKNGLPLPGIPIRISWEGGQEQFFTGLHPQVSPGYADFMMQTDGVYSVQAGLRGQTETGITAVDCTAEDGQTFSGGLWLTFVQP